MLKKLRKNTKKIKLNFKNKLSSIAFEGFGITILLGFISVILIYNIVTSVTGGLGNYQTYLTEKNTLEELKNTNEELQEDYVYYSSEEFKKLQLREEYDYVQPDELIFRTESGVQLYFDEEIEHLDVEAVDDYSEWWSLLIQ